MLFYWCVKALTKVHICGCYYYINLDLSQCQYIYIYFFIFQSLVCSDNSVCLAFNKTYAECIRKYE